jgi:hypothetical protein
MTMMVPLTMMAAPMGMGMMNPMSMAMPLMGAGSAMQMAPNMMSFNHQNQMANPFLGGPMGGNPYMQPNFMGMPMPFQAPQAAPSMPAFFPMMPQTAPAQAAPSFMPFMPQAAAPAQMAPAPAAMPFDPMMFMNMFAMPVAPQAAPAAK